MRKRLPPLLALLPALATATPSNIRFSAQAEAFSEPVSIDAFTSGWKDNLRTGDDAGMHARAELRADPGPWLVAWRWRYDYQLEFAPGTAELYHRIRNDLPLQPERAYPLDIRAYHVERQGPALGYRLKRDRIMLEASLTLYQGLSLIDGKTRGHAVFASPQAAGDQIRELMAVADYHYGEPQLQEEDLDWRPPPPDGWGYGLDISAHWQSDGGTSIALQIHDAAGEMHWRAVPGTSVKARCDCTIPSYDVNGGLYIRRNWQQRLNPWIQASAELPVTPAWKVSARVLADTWATLPQFGVVRTLGRQRASLLYEPHYRAWRLGYEHANTRLSWTADKLDTADASRLGVDLSLFWRW